VPCGATANSANGRLQKVNNELQCGLRAQKSKQAPEGEPDNEQ
jgi:hypothetical protein